MSEATGNTLLDKFIKYLIVQIPTMITGQKCLKSKRWQAQGIAIAKRIVYIKADLRFTHRP